MLQLTTGAATGSEHGVTDVAFYSVVGFLCASAPIFTVLVILRMLCGIGMGGEWVSVRRWPWRDSGGTMRVLGNLLLGADLGHL